MCPSLVVLNMHQCCWWLLIIALLLFPLKLPIYIDGENAYMIKRLKAVERLLFVLRVVQIISWQGKTFCYEAGSIENWTVSRKSCELILWRGLAYGGGGDISWNARSINNYSVACFSAKRLLLDDPTGNLKRHSVFMVHWESWIGKCHYSGCWKLIWYHRPLSLRFVLCSSQN